MAAWQRKVWTCQEFYAVWRRRSPAGSDVREGALGITRSPDFLLTTTGICPAR
jgi:hypothetical protein